LKIEHALADNIADVEKNQNFGFNCLHYSVSEASGSLSIMVINKLKTACKVRVRTIDAEAKAKTATHAGDYVALDDILSFNAGESSKNIKITIVDDDNWEPDKDFFIQLINPDTDEHLQGMDTRTKITIIDDDKPGHIYFQETKAISALASDEFAEIVIDRRNGSDGVVTVDFKTIELDESDHTASYNKDFMKVEKTCTFEAGQAQYTVKVPIVQHEGDEPRNESFAV